MREVVTAISAKADDILEQAMRAVQAVGAARFSALDALAAPLYATDTDVITYFNPACIEFAGRMPRRGEDRWCVTWRLYTDDGEPLSHDACPMAVALKEQRPIRGVTAVAERPNGSRVSFMPLPTPLLNAAGEMIGAFNVLIDLTDASAQAV